MNQLLKAFLKEASDLVQIGKAATTKQYAAVFAALFQGAQDIPAIVSNWGDLKPELDKLMSDPAADADLLAYAVALVGGEDAKAKAIIISAVDLLMSVALKGNALLQAIEMPSAAPAVVAAAATEAPIAEAAVEMKPQEQA